MPQALKPQIVKPNVIQPEQKKLLLQNPKSVKVKVNIPIKKDEPKEADKNVLTNSLEDQELNDDLDGIINSDRENNKVEKIPVKAPSTPVPKNEVNTLSQKSKSKKVDDIDDELYFE